MKIVSTKLHGILDYVLAVLMIGVAVLNLYQLNTSTRVILIIGALGILINSFATNYEFGFTRNISMVNHLRIDACIAMFICLLPVFFPFDYYEVPLGFGVSLFVSAILTNKVPYYKMFHQVEHRKFQKFPSIDL